MKRQHLAQRMYVVAGVLAVAGIGLTLSIILAGAGIVLLSVAGVLMLLAILIQLGEPALMRVPGSSGAFRGQEEGPRSPAPPLPPR